MKKQLVTIALLLAATCGSAQDKPAYTLFNAEGKKVGYQKMVRKLTQQDIVLFGEFHNNPISHWMELSLAKDLSVFMEMVLGAEMFEADNQQPAARADAFRREVEEIAAPVRRLTSSTRLSSR